jgi:D-beta-D-heptose 7-phosphate kinase/D-beta-D-heptose 1-phosphate adenosyltransferase
MPSVPREQFGFNDANILVFGDLTLDAYWHSTVNRISPEAPVAVSHYQESEYRLAGAAQVAAMIKTLGGKVELLSVVGATDLAQSPNIDNELTKLLDGYGVAYTLLPLADKTSHSIRIVSQAQQLLKIDEQLQQIESNKLQELYQQVANKISNYDTVIFYDNGHGIFNSQNAELLNKILEQCQNNNIKSIYLAAKSECVKNQASKVDYLIVNNNAEFDMSTLLNNVNSGLFIIDCLNKPKGLKYWSKNDQHDQHEQHDTKYLKPASVYCKTLSEVENIIGIPEAVTAVISLGLSVNNELKFVLDVAVATMSFVLMKFGQTILDIVELQLAYANYILQGEYNLLKLKQEIFAARNKGQKIVFANGCFDVLHIGHIAYLDAASKRGDKLFVAINSDYSISRLKGAERPINKLKDRMYVLSALQCVDWIVPFFTDTPEDFLSWLQPDLLIKGGDYTIDQVVGKELVYAYGGQVEVIKHPYTEISSTKIINNKHNKVTDE